MSSPTFPANNFSASGHVVQVQSVGKYKEVIKGMAGPASYVTGGVPLTAEDLDLTWIIWANNSTALSGDRLAHIIYPNNAGPNKQVLLMITDLAGTEVANASDQSAKLFRIRAQGEY